MTAILYADRMATDHLSVDDAFTERLKAHFSEAEMIELGVYVAVLIGFGRLTASWHITETVPEQYRGDNGGAPFAPWDNGGMLVNR